MQEGDLLRRGSSLPLYKVELASYRYPDDVDWIKARKFSLVNGGTEYVEGRKQTNKSMQAELVYVRERKRRRLSQQELAEWKFCVAVPCLALVNWRAGSLYCRRA
jgi:hypothetical protein